MSSLRLRTDRPGERRAPLRTLQEMADEFGVHVNTLANAMRNDPHHPKPRIVSRSVWTRHGWYVPAEVRLWWATRGLPEIADATGAAS